mmetsp:Transcript_92441/g.219944  ORF Transcript_92441/g.219944 Transcript_92441/m.219944 type:complete len:256 (-) Transcript_92441:185-952(-)
MEPKGSIVGRSAKTVASDEVERLLQAPPDRPAPREEQLVELQDHDVHDEDHPVAVRNLVEVRLSHSEELLRVLQALTAPQRICVTQHGTGLQAHLVLASDEVHQFEEECLAARRSRGFAVAEFAGASRGLQKMQLVPLQEILRDSPSSATQNRGRRGVPNLKEDAGGVVPNLDQSHVPVGSQELVHPSHSLKNSCVATVPEVFDAVPPPEIILALVLRFLRLRLVCVSCLHRLGAQKGRQLRGPLAALRRGHAAL